MGKTAEAVSRGALCGLAAERITLSFCERRVWPNCDANKKKRGIGTLGIPTNGGGRGSGATGKLPKRWGGKRPHTW